MKPTMQAARIPIGEVGQDGKVYLTRAWYQFFFDGKGVTDDVQTRIDSLEADSFVSDIHPVPDLDMAPEPMMLEPETDLSGRLEALESLVAHLMDKIEDLEGSP